MAPWGAAAHSLRTIDLQAFNTDTRNSGAGEDHNSRHSPLTYMHVKMCKVVDLNTVIHIQAPEGSEMDALG